MSTINPNKLVLLVATIVPITLITTYTITDKIHPDEQIIPFISSSINNAPESCIGSYGLSIAAFLMVLIVLIRYLFLKNNISNNASSYSGVGKLNLVSAWIGVISAFSMNGVASFQYKNAMIPHLLFAALFFICGFIYIVTQTIIDGKVSTNTSPIILIVRKILCCICSLFVVYVILQFFHNLVLKNLSAVFEIISAGCIFVYLVTYYHEFSKIKVNIDFSLNNNYLSTKQNEPLFGY